MTATFQIGTRQVGANEPPFVILEVGINHNGDLTKAVEMIKTARACNADAVKFQTFKAPEFVGNADLTFTYQSQGKSVTESMRTMFERAEFTRPQWRKIREACDDADIIFMSTPQNPSDLELLLEIGIPAVKIGSDDFNNLPLITRYCETRLPIILSCGMADMEEVARSLATVDAAGSPPVAVLVCTSQYPTPPGDANLRRITTLKEQFPRVVVGFSDHTQGVHAAVIAAALGAQVFEKHFTLDRDLPGPDHWFSADPVEAAAWVDAIRAVPVYLGHGRIEPTPEEIKMRTLARRSVTALRPIAAGETFSLENVGLRRPGIGLPPAQISNVLGRRAARDIAPGVQLKADDFA